MQVLAIIALVWQRRRVGALLRRAWDALARERAGRPGPDRVERVAGLGRAAAASAWRAVDTEPNAARVARLVERMRAFANRSRLEGVRHG